MSERYVLVPVRMSQQQIDATIGRHEVPCNPWEPCMGIKIVDHRDGFLSEVLYNAAVASRPPAGEEVVDVLENVEAVMSIVQPRSDTAEYLACLGRVRAVLDTLTGERTC